MKKIFWISFVLIFCILFSGCLNNEENTEATPDLTDEIIKQEIDEDVAAYFGKEMRSNNIADNITADHALDQYLAGRGGFIYGYGTSKNGITIILVDEDFKNSGMHEKIKKYFEKPEKNPDENLKQVVETIKIIQDYGMKKGIEDPLIVFLVAEEAPPL